MNRILFDPAENRGGEVRLAGPRAHHDWAVLQAQPGDTVRVGDVIGAVGDTALCEIGEAYHLHFAMKLNGVSADPANWLPER